MLHVDPAFSRLGKENAFAVLARATELQRQGRDIINLGIGQPDFLTPPHIVEAAVKALRDGQHGYTPANGIRRCARRSRPISFGATASKSRPTGADRAGRQGDDVHGDLMFGGRRRNPLSRPRLSNLSLDDRIHRRAPRRRSRCAKKTALLSRPGNAGADHPARRGC